MSRPVKPVCRSATVFPEQLTAVFLRVVSCGFR